MALLPRQTKKKYPKVATHSGVNPFLGSFALILLCAILMIASFVNANLTNSIRSNALNVISPIIETVVSPVVYVSDVFGSMSGLTELTAMNLELKQENTKLKQWHQVAVSLKAENERLKSLLNTQPEPVKNFITTRIIADTGSQFANSFVIPVGYDAGVRKGQAVLSEKSMIGRIVETSSNVARILLVTDLNSRVPVLIEGIDAKAVLAGNNSDNPELIHLPAQTEIPENASVLTSGHGGILPPGLLIGHVRYDANGERKIELLSNPALSHYVQIVDYKLDATLK